MPNRKLHPFKVGIDAEEDARKLLGDFESLDAAKAERKVRVKALRGLKGKHASRLRKALKRCRRGRRCLLSICPVCMRRYRIWYAAQHLRLFLWAGPLVLATLVDPDDAFPAEELEGFQPKVLIERVRHRLRRAGVDGVLIGGLDGEFDDGRGKFQPHLHFICQASQAANLMDMARQYYPSSDTVYRGMVIKPIRDSFEDLAKAATYTCKSFWPRTFHGAGLRVVKPKRLRPAMHAAWLSWLGQFGLGDLQLFYGVRRRGANLVMTPSNRIRHGEIKVSSNEGLVERNEGKVGNLVTLTHGNTTNEHSGSSQAAPKSSGQSVGEAFFRSMATAEIATQLEREEILRGLGRARDLTGNQQQKLVARVRKLST